MRFNFHVHKPIITRENMVHAFWAWVGSSLCVLCIAILDSILFAASNVHFLMASFGASAVLVFGVPKSPLAQPRNVLGGHFVSAIAGVSCEIFLGFLPEVAACTAVSSAIFLMTITKTMHPPGGATALLAVVGDTSIKNLGYLYAVVPCLLGAAVVVGIGILMARVSHRRHVYPQIWW